MDLSFKRENKEEAQGFSNLSGRSADDRLIRTFRQEK
jgi:hypothetical protein